MIGDKVVTWFIQNIVTPQQEIIDKPGFIITSLSEKGKKTYLRDLLLSESFFEKTEEKVLKEYGAKGANVLYSAGKKFGYVYASLLTLPQLGKVSDRDLLNFAYFFVRYIAAGTFSSDAAHTIDLASKTFKIRLKEYVVCRHDGIGLVMADGGIAGIWAWICDDSSIEGIQTKCQGRGDNECEVICAPIQKLKKLSKKVYIQKDLQVYKFDEQYLVRNKIRNTKYSKNSLKVLLNNNFFDFKNGIFSYGGKRLFLDDSHIMYILENEMRKLPKGEELLFDAAFEEGKEIGKIYGKDGWNKLILDLFSAFGFGDVAILNVKNPKIGIIYYPWTKLSATSKYVVIRGLISGIITQCTGKDNMLKLVSMDVREYLTIVIGVGA